MAMFTSGKLLSMSCFDIAACHGSAERMSVKLPSPLQCMAVSPKTPRQLTCNMPCADATASRDGTADVVIGSNVLTSCALQWCHSCGMRLQGSEDVSDIAHPTARI